MYLWQRTNKKTQNLRFIENIIFLHFKDKKRIRNKKILLKKRMRFPLYARKCCCLYSLI
jgi:hypothetical protein